MLVKTYNLFKLGVITAVTQADVGSYVCLFTIYPTGAQLCKAHAINNEMDTHLVPRPVFVSRTSTISPDFRETSSSAAAV